MQQFAKVYFIPQERDAVTDACKMEVEVDGLGVADVQHAIGLWRESRAHLGMLRLR